MIKLAKRVGLGPCYLFWLLSSQLELQFLERKNSIFKYSKLTEYPSVIRLDKDKFDFKFEILMDNQYTINPSLFTFKSNIFTRVNGDFQILLFEIESCTLNSLSKGIVQLYQKGLFCLPKSITNV